MNDPTEPIVCAILLTADRPEFTKRAVRCFQAQTYERKFLVILDTSEGYGSDTIRANVVCYTRPQFRGRTIGDLRNIANGINEGTDIICHWDSDDYSHPNRITEQVALLQSSGKEVVGYRDMLFWRLKYNPLRPTPVGEAWLFTHPDPRYCLGTSLCYWRKTWERKPFKDLPKPGSTGEDWEFLNGLDSLGVSCIGENEMPLMIASIHGGNTSGQYLDIERSSSWERVPAYDGYCKRQWRKREKEGISRAAY